MKTFLGGVATAALLLSGALSSANAATTTYDRGSIGTFTGSDTGGDYFKINAAMQMFDLAYTFTLDVAGYVSAGATNAYTTATSANGPTTTKISNFLLTVDGVSGVYSDVLSVQHSDYPPLNTLILLDPGTYKLDITGTTGVPNSAVGLTFSFAAAQSTVPLPHSVALFGVAIAGLGVFGAAKRKSQKMAV